MNSKLTRFRAYQLGTEGSSYSYCANGHFSLVEARLTELSRITLTQEMFECGVEVIDVLHITSWDQDHCNFSELEVLFDLVNPLSIECPGCEPKTENGLKCQRFIKNYKACREGTNRAVHVKSITPDYIRNLGKADVYGFNNVILNPFFLDEECSNNNSTIKLFRNGSFNVLSLGDVECSKISSRLRRSPILQKETDIMILSHHGADNGFTNQRLIANTKPSLAICASNYDNKFDHPRDEVRNILKKNKVPLLTTKTGDIVIQSVNEEESYFEAYNFISNTTKINSLNIYQSKKSKILSHNADTIRDSYKPKKRYPK
jgi:competence protein ComEC